MNGRNERISLGLLCVFACVLGLFAQPAADLAFKAAADGIDALAEDGFRRALTEEGISEDKRIQLQIGLARVLMAQSRFKEALEVLPSDTGNPEVSLLAADCLLAGEDLQWVPRLLAEAEGAPLTDVQTSRLLQLQIRYASRSGDLKGLPPETASADGGKIETLPAPVQLEVARLWLKQGKTNAWHTVVSRVATGDISRLETQTARFALAEQDLARGKASNAVSRLEPLMHSNLLHKVLASDMHWLRARALPQMGMTTQAVEHVDALVEATEDPIKRVDLKVYRAGLMIDLERFDEATKLLNEQIALGGDRDPSGRTLLRLGDALMAEDAYEKAEGVFGTYLEVFANKQGQIHALKGVAAAAERLEAPERAARAYMQAAQRVPDDDAALRVPLHLKAAEQLIAAGKCSEAIPELNAVISTSIDQTEIATATFQKAQCLRRTKKVEEALSTLQLLLLRFPTSEVAERAQLAVAGVLNEALRLEQALGAYDAYLRRYPKGKFVAEAQMEKGLAAYRLGLFDMALGLFDTVLKEHAEDELAEQAYFMRGWAMFLMGREEQALQVFRNFVKTYPDSERAGDVEFVIAEYLYNHGEFKKAEAAFVALSDSTDDKSAQARAWYLAGRSAMGQKAFEDAIKHLQRSLDSDPEAERVPDVLFLQGDALTELNRFDEAIVQFDTLIEKHKNSYLVYPAWGRKGDCQFTLGEKEARRYKEAFTSYQTVVDAESAELGLKLQARYKLGRVAEKLGRTKEARDLYMETAYQYLDKRDRVGKDAEVWFVRAATAAAEIFEKQEKWREAIGVYSLLVDANVPQAAEAKKLMRALQFEHLIFF